MKKITHKSESAIKHYSKEAFSEGSFASKFKSTINSTIEKLCKKYAVKTICDLSCGAGSQVFYLSEKGFDIIGFDISAKMLSIAKQKAIEYNKEFSFKIGDMRTTQAGSFDAVCTIDSAIGHLTKTDFSIALSNIWNNLKPNGYYIFDIFNSEYFLTGTNITQLTIDWIGKNTQNLLMRKIQYSTISNDGILTSYTTRYNEIPNSATPKMVKDTLTLQLYNSAELKELLEQNNFKILQQYNVDGTTFEPKKSERILTVAQKL